VGTTVGDLDKLSSFLNGKTTEVMFSLLYRVSNKEAPRTSRLISLVSTHPTPGAGQSRITAFYMLMIAPVILTLHGFQGAWLKVYSSSSPSSVAFLVFAPAGKARGP
jgi:hypothetical protein